MSDSTDISVIICCYKPSFEKLIKTIISVEKQQGVSFDIVATDDGSEVDYFEEAEKWAIKNGFTNIYFNKIAKNVGTVKNILFALKYCKAEYVKTISPGDYLFDEHSLKNYLECFERDGASIVSGKSVYFTDDGTIVPSAFPKLEQSCKRKYMKRNLVKYDDSLLGASMAFKKAFLKEGLEEIKNVVRYLEDKPLVNMCLMTGGIVSFSQEKLVWYETGNGISTSNSPNPLFIKDLDSYYSSISESEEKYYRYVSNVYFHNKKWSKIKKIILYPFVHPGYFLFKIRTILRRHSLIEMDITKQYRITSLEKGE